MERSITCPWLHKILKDLPMTKDFLMKRIDELKQQIELCAGQLNQMIGRLQESEGMLKCLIIQEEKVDPPTD